MATQPDKEEERITEMFDKYYQKRDSHLEIVRELVYLVNNPIFTIGIKIEMIDQILREMNLQIIMAYKFQADVMKLDLTSSLMVNRKLGNIKKEKKAKPAEAVKVPSDTSKKADKKLSKTLDSKQAVVTSKVLEYADSDSSNETFALSPSKYDPTDRREDEVQSEDEVVPVEKEVTSTDKDKSSTKASKSKNETNKTGDRTRR